MNNLFEIFYVVKAHGIRGDVEVRLLCEHLPKSINAVDKDGNFFEFHLKKGLSHCDKCIAHIVGVEDRTSAADLRGRMFFAKKSILPQLSNNEYYVCDLIGRKVSVSQSSIVCMVTDVQNYGAGDVLELAYDGKTFMIPFLECFFCENDDGEFELDKGGFESYYNL